MTKIEEGYKLLLKQFAELFIENINFTAAYYKNLKVNKDTLSDSDLLKSLKVDVNNLELSISIASYYIDIENGRKKNAKRIPIDVIIRWLKKKKIVPTNKSGNFRGKKFNASKFRGGKNKGFVSINALAIIISKSIKRFGIPKRPFVSEAFEITYDEFASIIDKETQKVLDQTLINIKKPI